MKATLAILIFLILAVYCPAQEPVNLPNTNLEQQLENLTESNDAENEDDNYLQHLQDLKLRPLNINTASESDLKALVFLKPLQIQNLLTYIKLLGKLLSIFELQAIPGWDVELIQKIRPYVYVGPALSVIEDFSKRFNGGENSLLIRAAQILEKSRGFTIEDSTGPKYVGSRQRLFLRYRYQYKNLLQFGLVADKDAGEQLFKGNQKSGFDFYSFHLFARNMGVIKNLALGDFTVNMGQGLISWQTLAFRKSSDVTGTKRQADVLKPYNSAGEFNFQRGAGITLQKNKWQATAFVSYKKISANAVVDTANFEDYFSSLLTSGLHRSQSELTDKNTINQLTVGGNINYRYNKLQVGINAINYTFSKPLQKDNQPYNAYTIGGKQITNASVDYSYTYKNMHFFGEVATDGQADLAMVHGLLASLDKKTDVSLLYRNISRAYGSINTNAFTESTTPINENGFFAGIEIRPAIGFKLDAYFDVFSFPYLRFRVDKPSSGADYLLQLAWKPNKQLELYTRFVSQSKAINLSNTNLPTHITINRPKQNWRTNFTYKLSPTITTRGRVELLWFDKNSNTPETGFLSYIDVVYKPMLQPLSANLRLQYFETDGFDSRLYAYENDVAFSFSIPQFSGKGYRYFLNINYDVSKKLSAWLRIAQTLYPDKTTVGSGFDEIKNNHQTEVKLQLQYRF